MSFLSFLLEAPKRIAQNGYKYAAGQLISNRPITIDGDEHVDFLDGINKARIDYATRIAEAQAAALAAANMDDHQLGTLVNDLADISHAFGQTQQLRERISHRVKQAIRGVA